MEENYSRKPVCKYGAECYRTNDQHKEDYWHPKKRKSIEQEPDDHETEQVAKKRKSNVEIEEASDSPSKESVQGAGDTSCEEVEPVRPATPPNLNPQDEILFRFQMKMPKDFYDFWSFCKSLGDNPTDVLKPLGLQLVGPYDVLSGKLTGTSATLCKRQSALLHWRYYYDPPEFQTIIRGDDQTYHHLGYYRDDANKLPVFVGSNHAKDGCTITAQGENVFAAVGLHIHKLCKSPQESTEIEACKAIQAKLTVWAKKCGHSLEAKTTAMKARDKKVVTKTFHGAGIVVEIDDSGVGYRELPETDANLKRIFKKIANSESETQRNRNYEPLDEIVSFVQFANDECDYGQGYELGIDMFAYGSAELHDMVRNILPLAYTLLGRGVFGEILHLHLRDRRMDDLSMV